MTGEMGPGREDPKVVTDEDSVHRDLGRRLGKLGLGVLQ